jgi:hypothetical protein
MVNRGATLVVPPGTIEIVKGGWVPDQVNALTSHWVTPAGVLMEGSGVDWAKTVEAKIAATVA